MLAELGRLIPGMQGNAAALDAVEAFPTEDIAALRGMGALMAPVPVRLGGWGAGTEPVGAELLFEVLRLLGQGNMAVGRLYEAHVNALHLIALHGTPRQLEQAAVAAQEGHLFGLWVTDSPGHPVTMSKGTLRGSKAPCSGAGHVTRTLITVGTDSGTRMAVVGLNGSSGVVPMVGVMHGMRACCHGTMGFDGAALPVNAFIGPPDAYLAEPSLSAGAWRTMAVTLGGLDALVATTRAQLVQKGQAGAPLQQERFGLMLIAQETARLWTADAGRRAESGDADTADLVAYVNLARIAVEAACLDAMRLAQRALGLGALLRPNPVERLLRDLTTYLRQPAPDAVLTEAAQYALAS